MSQKILIIVRRKSIIAAIFGNKVMAMIFSSYMAIFSLEVLNLVNRIGRRENDSGLKLFHYFTSSLRTA